MALDHHPPTTTGPPRGEQPPCTARLLSERARDAVERDEELRERLLRPGCLHSRIAVTHHHGVETETITDVILVPPHVLEIRQVQSGTFRTSVRQLTSRGWKRLLTHEAPAAAAESDPASVGERVHQEALARAAIILQMQASKSAS